MPEDQLAYLLRMDEDEFITLREKLSENKIPQARKALHDLMVS